MNIKNILTALLLVMAITMANAQKPAVPNASPEANTVSQDGWQDSRSEVVLMPGDYPDPSILKDGDDYYMTHSPFHYQPGFLIWHSKDLLHWKPICRAGEDWKGSAWAPDLQKVGDTYYIYFPADETNWVITAKDIRGPWSMPVDLKIGGIDPGLLVTPEGVICSPMPDK